MLTNKYTSSSLSHEHRHDKHQCHKGEDESTNGANGEGEPEAFFCSVHKEGDEPNHRGGDGQQNGYDFMIVCLDEPFPVMIIFIHQIDASIDGESTQQHHRCKTSCSEFCSTEMIGQECTNHRDGNEQNDDQSLIEAFEEDGTDEEDDDSHKSNEPVLCPVILIPSIRPIQTTEANRKLRIEFFCHLFDILAGVSVGAQHVESHPKDVFLILTRNAVFGFPSSDGHEIRHLHITVRHFDIGIFQLPQVKIIMLSGTKYNVHFLSSMILAS